MSEYQNIVIIGGSVAGHNLANALAPILPATHRILVIDANDFAYWPIAGLRAAVVPGWENKLFAPISQATFFKSGPHEVIAPNRVLELKENSVILEKPWEGKTEIPFFKCVLATGSSQNLPMRPSAPTMEGTKEDLRKMQKDIEGAQKVVVIGGGPAGIEMAGEIRDKYPTKEISLIHNRSSLLNPPNATPASKGEVYTPPATTAKISRNLERDLKANNITLYLEDRAEPSNAPGEWDGTHGVLGGTKTLKLRSGKAIEADFVFVSTGNTPGAALVEKVDKGAVADRMINVDEFLRVKSKSPDSILTKNYYAIGDCCTTPGWKTSQGAGADGKYVANNIVADVKGGKPTKYTRPTLHAFIVPIGASKGQGYATMPLLGDTALPGFMIPLAKGKNLLLNEAFLPVYQGAEKVPAVTY